MAKKLKSNNSVRFSKESFTSNKITLYQEVRLIERNENEIHVMWKGAHMLMFFLAFVFGSFCTCCFHMLMRMFDNKCVLFPRLVSHKSLRLIVYEFFSIKLEGIEDELNVQPDFVSAKWSDNSVCYLPTYVPLMSGLGGLVWATMFLMCSGSSTVTGPPRQWRALPFIFVFSVVMSVLCIYASVFTHNGLRELCMKLAEVTGSSSPYTINVATLAYERRIRGVYQATRLTIASAWLHTFCWVISALLVTARVLFAVDFTLVNVKAQLVGDVDKMLQKYEDQINSISPDSPKLCEDDSEVELYATNTAKSPKSKIQFQITGSMSNVQPSEFALVPEEKHKIHHNYIWQFVSDLVDNISKGTVLQSTAETMNLTSYKADANIDKRLSDPTEEFINVDRITQEVIQHFKGKLSQQLNEFEHQMKSNLKSKIDKGKDDRKLFRLRISGESVDKEPPIYVNKPEEKEIDKNKGIDKTNGKSMVTPTDSERTLTPPYFQLNENKIANERTQKKKKGDEHIDDIDAVRELHILDAIETTDKATPEKEKTVSEHTLTPYSYYKMVEENKEIDPTENKLKKKNSTNENDRSEDVDTVRKLHIFDENRAKTTTPENEDVDEGLKKSKEEVRKFEEIKKEKPVQKENDDDQDSKTKEKIRKVEQKKKEEDSTKDDEDKGH